MSKAIVTFMDVKDQGVRVAVRFEPTIKQSGPKAEVVTPAQQAGMYFMRKVLSEMKQEEEKQ